MPCVGSGAGTCQLHMLLSPCLHPQVRAMCPACHVYRVALELACSCTCPSLPFRLLTGPCSHTRVRGCLQISFFEPMAKRAYLMSNPNQCWPIPGAGANRCLCCCASRSGGWLAAAAKPVHAHISRQQPLTHCAGAIVRCCHSPYHPSSPCAPSPLQPRRVSTPPRASSRTPTACTRLRRACGWSCETSPGERVGGTCLCWSLLASCEGQLVWSFGCTARKLGGCSCLRAAEVLTLGKCKQRSRQHACTQAAHHMSHGCTSAPALPVCQEAGPLRHVLPAIPACRYPAGCLDNSMMAAASYGQLPKGAPPLAPMCMLPAA